MANALAGLKPELVWDIFEQICQVPRPSKHEEKISAYLINWANERNFEVKKDAIGNFVICKPATPGMENRQTVCIQGHVDMVCEKNSDVEFDFFNDPIQAYVDGEWVKAKGTTLGADNGIGVAMGLAVLESKDVAHPAMEILCTMDEETGLTGAIRLSSDLLTAKILINLDSEEDGAFTIGCAGGLNTKGIYKYEADAIPADSVAYKISVKGLKGGHSGIEIHDGRGNAAQFMTRIVWTAQNKLNIRLSDFNSGNKHNAIQREAFATVVLPKAAESDFLALISEYDSIYKAEYATKEPNLTIFATACELPTRILKLENQKSLLNSFYAMPHGVNRMSPDIAGLVQTSNNFAIVETLENTIEVLTSQRSSVETERFHMAHKVQSTFELGGAVVEYGDGYPGWQPNINSPILKQGVEVFKSMYGKEPHIEAIHAGLECGLIGEKYPGMDMISFGPTLKDVHSPDERVNIPAVGRCWDFLVELLKVIPTK